MPNVPKLSNQQAIGMLLAARLVFGRRLAFIVAMAAGGFVSHERLFGQQPSATIPAPTRMAPATTSAASTDKSTSASQKAAPLTIAQIRTNLPPTPAGQFEFLRRQRKVTLEAIDQTTTRLKTLTAEIASILQQPAPFLNIAPTSFTKARADFELQRAKADVAETKQKLDEAKKTPARPPAEIAKLEEEFRQRERSVAQIEEAIAKEEQLQKENEINRAEYLKAKKETDEALARLTNEKDETTEAQQSYQRLLGEIDDMVNQLFIASDATNSFKLKMSIILSILIAVVIAGFFIVAWSDDEVKRKIFSNEAGIQFITLFAIVISVILFGIIGVLESKELSALLGGLSGYILGRKA